jgi:ribose 5-phosphate isomerase B
LPEKIKIAIGSDHAGFNLKEKVRAYLQSQGYEVNDFGPESPNSVDYPDFAEKVATDVARGGARFGVLTCGTGLGMALAANKVPGVRATTCHDTLLAHFARAHNNANVLTMGGRIVGPATAEKILDTWLSTPFEGGRHEGRVEKIAAIDQTHHAEKKS